MLIITWGEYRRIAYMTLRFTAAVLLGTAIGYGYRTMPEQPQTRLHLPCVAAMRVCVL
ncbi:MAG TPA: hypothetical protein VNH39_01035 [Steroidobacteraceae bacterium]|nr:hypothetical protein [Steroidobacteraceae bacterium]